jgi:hypothetical protein
MTPTQRTLAMLRTDGWTCEVVEKWNPAVKRRHDLFGIFDVLAIRDGETMGVQVTSYSNVAARIRKIAESEHIAAIRKAGWRVCVHGWHKPKNRWICREVDIS